MYMKLEFSTKLNIIREKRRLCAQRDRTERENNKNISKQEESIFKKEIPNMHSMEDKKLLLQKLHFINNPNAQQPFQVKHAKQGKQRQQQSQKNLPNSSIDKNKTTQMNNLQLNTNAQIIEINDSNCENISIIVSEIIPCAKNKFYE